MAHSSIRRNCFAVVTRGLLFVAALSSASPAFAVWNTYAIAPGPEAAARPELLQLPPGSPSASTVRLEADATLESRILALKRANSVSETKVLQIGVGRDVPQVPEASSAALRWERVAGGMAAQWRVSSLGARASRDARPTNVEMPTRLGEQIDPAPVTRGTVFEVKHLRRQELVDHGRKPCHQVSPGFGGVDRCSDGFRNSHPGATLLLGGLPASRC